MTQASSSSRKRIEWMWKSNVDSWSSGEKEDWCAFSDVETIIIEAAFQRKLPRTSLDDCHVDLKKLVQISNKDQNKQRPIKRIAKDKVKPDRRLREARFMSNPTNPSISFAESISCMGFVNEVLHRFNLLDDTSLREVTNRNMLVEKAVEGLIIEGKLAGKQQEAEWMAQQLANMNGGTEEDIWKCCARLYTMESFLYKKMNEYMRLGGDSEHRELWRSKMSTLGPFAYLLSILAIDRNYKKITVYRGASLTDDMIEQYRRNVDRYVNFPAFTSASRNRKKAEQFGNALFVMDISSLHGSDVSPYSYYPDEEETLIKPDFVFYIESCMLNKTLNKWIIHLSTHRDE